MTPSTSSPDSLTSQFAPLLLSCDKYADVWAPCLQLYRRYWPDLPWRPRLVSNDLAPRNLDVDALLVGEDVSWSDSLARALELVAEPYVMLLLDDLLLTQPVHTQAVVDALRWVVEHDANYLRLNPSPPPDRDLGAHIGAVREGSLYRTSTVFTIWKRSVLAALLRPGESAWEFELCGSARSDAYGGFYSVKRPCFRFLNSIIKGAWTRPAIRLLEVEGIPIDLEQRRVMSRADSAVLAFLEVRAWALRRLPARYRRPVRDFFRTSR